MSFYDLMYMLNVAGCIGCTVAAHVCIHIHTYSQSAFTIVNHSVAAPSAQGHMMHPHEHPPSMPVEPMTGVPTSCYHSAVGMLQAVGHVDQDKRSHTVPHPVFATSRRVQEARQQIHVQRLPRDEGNHSQFGLILAA